MRRTVWNLPICRYKTRLNILVMLTPLFQSKGPHDFSRQYTWPYRGLLVGTDPVATDATGLGILRAKRLDFFGEDQPFEVPPKHIRVAEQKFGLGVAKDIGYDLEHGRLDVTAHPFCVGAIQDVRITTRFKENDIRPSLFAVIHETGHAMYQQGLNTDYYGTPMGAVVSLGLHESQSRMWENLVGRSMPFWRHYYPKLQQTFPKQFGNVALEDFYAASNLVKPSLIRVEADEVTYNLHIMLRLELEIALIEGKLAVKDLPDAWNQAMQDYLGILPPDDARGILQDVHWSSGMMGYFSTYALGNLVSAQFWDRIQADIPDLEDQIRRGEFSTLLDWVRRHVHRHGAKFEPQELVQKITGSRIDPKPYVKYLQTKYSQIYQL